MRAQEQRQPRRRGRQRLIQAQVPPPVQENQQQDQVLDQRNDQRPIQEEHANGQDDLANVYNNIRSIPSFSSKITEFLRQNETSSLHKKIRRKFKRRKTITYFPFDICMADVAFYNDPSYVRANGGFKYILVFIDVFSKMCYVEPT